MATVTDSGAVTASTDNQATYASASFNPASGDLLVVLVAASGTVDAGDITVSANGVTSMTRVDQSISNTSANSQYIFVADQLTTGTAAMTVTFDCTGDSATGCIVMVARVSGMDKTGATAIKQSVKLDNGAGGTTPTFTFPAACQTGNPTLVVLGQVANAPASVPPTNWTEAVDTSISTPTYGGTYVFRDSGFTGTTITWGDTETAHGGVAVELDASSSGTAHTQSPTDNSGLVDSQTIVNTKPPVTPTDSAGSLDAQSFVTDYVITVDDPTGLADTATPVNGPAVAAAVVGSGASANSALGQTIAFTLPASIPEDCLLLFAVNANSAAGTVTNVSNVTETVLDLQRTGDPVVLSAYLFRATVGSANNGQTVTITWSNTNVKITCAWIVIDGVRPTLNAFPPAINDADAGDTIAPIPAATPTVGDAFLVSFVSGQHGTAGTTYTKDADYTLGGSAFYGGADPKQSTSVSYLQLTTDAGVTRSGDQHDWSASSREVSWVVGLQPNVSAAAFQLLPTDAATLADSINNVSVTGQASAAFGGDHIALGIRRVLGTAGAAFGFTGSAQGIHRVLGAAQGAFGFTATAQGVIVERYWFTPPTHEEPMRTNVPPLNRHRLTHAASIVRIGGVLTPYRNPNHDMLRDAGVEGVDYFIGGNIYFVSDATKAELLSLGYTVNTV